MASSDVTEASSTRVDPKSDSSPQDLVLKVLAAAGTSIGILGFVTFFGGAILWLRADQAKLPANDAVSAVPHGVLVTTGASFLVPAVLIAIATLSAIFLVRVICDLIRRIRNRRLLNGAQSMRPEAEKLEAEAEAQARLAEAVRELSSGPTRSAQEAFEEEALAENLKSQAAQRRAEAEKKEAAAAQALKRPIGQFLFETGFGFLVLLLLPPILNGAIGHVGFWKGVLLGFIALTAAAVSMVTYATQKMVWFGIVAFIAVGIYIGAATYYSTTGNPKVEPAAVLRGPRSPLVGSFIADTSSNLYLGTFPEGERQPRLLVIPRSQVTALAIGPLLDPAEARSRAIALALDECHQKIDVAKSGKTNAHTDLACSKEQLKGLQNQ